jgi:hypothetical protein
VRVSTPLLSDKWVVLAEKGASPPAA